MSKRIDKLMKKAPPMRWRTKPYNWNNWHMLYEFDRIWWNGYRLLQKILKK